MTRRPDGWRSRPLLSAALRCVVAVAPIVASVTFAALTRRLVPAPLDPGMRALWIVGSLCISTAVLMLTARAARRLLPLAVLLRLSLAFPAEAPRRLRVARLAGGTRDLQERLERARREGFAGSATSAAEQILSLIAAIESHDRATRGHSERVRLYADLLARELRLPEEDRNRLSWAALLHDVGKLSVPGAVLRKPGPLDDGEWDHVHRHPGEGAAMIGSLRAWLSEWASAIEEHHERWDGTGYPHGRWGEGISLGGRIVAVADAYETMTAPRPYRPAMRPDIARAELVACSGTQFDPQIVRTFLRISVRPAGIGSAVASWTAQVPVLRHVHQTASAAGQAAAVVAERIAIVTVAAGSVLALTVPTGPSHDTPARRPAVVRPADAAPATVDGATVPVASVDRPSTATAAERDEPSNLEALEKTPPDETNVESGKDVATPVTTGLGDGTTTTPDDGSGESGTGDDQGADEENGRGNEDQDDESGQGDGDGNGNGDGNGKGKGKGKGHDNEADDQAEEDPSGDEGDEHDDQDDASGDDVGGDDDGTEGGDEGGDLNEGTEGEGEDEDTDLDEDGEDGNAGNGDGDGSNENGSNGNGNGHGGNGNGGNGNGGNGNGNGG